jgi:hypothetical protein
MCKTQVLIELHTRECEVCPVQVVDKHERAAEDHDAAQRLALPTLQRDQLLRLHVR